jgi:flagellar biosynthesis protein FlhG
LARLGKKVLLLDVDLNLSNINIMLDVKVDQTLYHFLKDKVTLPELINKYLPNLHFLFGDSGKSDHPEMNETNSQKIFNGLREISSNYDFILLDTGSGVGEEVMSFLTYSDFNVIVTTPEPTSIMDAYVVVKLLSREGIKQNKFIVVNRCNNENEANLAFENLNKASLHFLKESLQSAGWLPYSEKASRSILDQKLYIAENTETHLSKRIYSLARKISKIKQVANNNQ